MNDSVFASAEAFQIDPAFTLFQNERIPEIFARCAQIPFPEAHVVVKQLRVIGSLRRGNDKGNAEKRYDPIPVIVADEPPGNVKAVLLPALVERVKDLIAIGDRIFCKRGFFVE